MTTKTTSRNGDWFLTFTGKKFYPTDPRPSEICIADIAHSLAHICRFGGHVRRFYSVAQHSVIVSYHCNYPLIGLLHDATEAYCGDMVRPLKLMLPEYQLVEKRLWWAVSFAFGLPEEMPLEIKAADNRALMTERRDLLTKTDDVWSLEKSFPPFQEPIFPQSPAVAEAQFLARYWELVKSTPSTQEAA